MTEKLYSFENPAEYIRVACRLCGDIWKFPIAYKECFDESPVSWECPHCRRSWPYSRKEVSVL